MPDDENPHMKTVPCVDDEKGIRASVKRLLRPLRHLLAARNGLEAIGIISRDWPDLVILDVRMPHMDGYETLSWLRENGKQETPVIMLTVEESDESLLKGYNEGCTYYITKPFQNKHLVNIVQYLIGDLTGEERAALEVRL